MIQLFDKTTMDCSRLVTKRYSTSFYSAVNLLDKKIVPAIHAVYGFVRFADEIVDTFHEYNQKELLLQFEKDFYKAMNDKISLNPILHSFQKVVHQYAIPDHLIQAFLNSMKKDLEVSNYSSKEEIDEYINGSANVVGLMCLKVFVQGNEKEYQELEFSASRLGSAFQKVNFLRDLKQDLQDLDRSYFPEIDFSEMTEEVKQQIIADIQADFDNAYVGIVKLPNTAQLGVYTAYKYYLTLLKKLQKTQADQILNKRIRVSNFQKMIVLMKSIIRYKLNLL